MFGRRGEEIGDRVGENKIAGLRDIFTIYRVEKEILFSLLLYSVYFVEG